MDQMEKKEQSDNFETIFNRFLDLKNGWVHEKPVNCKILGFRLVFIRWSEWTRMEEKPEWWRKRSLTIPKPSPIDFSTSKTVISWFLAIFDRPSRRNPQMSKTIFQSFLIISRLARMLTSWFSFEKGSSSSVLLYEFSPSSHHWLFRLFSQKDYLTLYSQVNHY